MIFWIIFIVLTIGIGLIIIGTRNWDSNKHHWLWYYDSELTTAGVITTAFTTLVLVIMSLCILESHWGSEAEFAVLRERENALVYKVESGACRDDFGLLNKSVIDEIQEWNETIVKNKKLQNNFWLGIFYPDIYDEFETIDYTKYKKK